MHALYRAWQIKSILEYQHPPLIVVHIERWMFLFYNYFNQENNYIDKELIGELNVYLLDNKLSIIKYKIRQLFFYFP